MRASHPVIMKYEYIDPAPFQHLVRLAARANHPALQASLEQTPAEIDSLCSEVLRAMADPHRAKLDALAHRMKGMAATLGANRLKDMAGALMSPNAACDARAQAELREVCDKTREEIARLLQVPPDRLTQTGPSAP